MRKSPRFHQKQPKTLKTYLPQPQVVRIQQRHVAGQKNSEIARAENCDRHTVARIVKAPEMAAYVERMKERFRGFAPLAMDTVEFGLSERKDARLACEVLKAVGVIEPGGYKVPVEQQDEQERERQLEVEWIGILSLIAMEKNSIYGVELPSHLAGLKYPLDLEQVKSAVTALIKAKESRKPSSEGQEDDEDDE